MRQEKELQKLGQRLRWLRQKRGLRLQDMAERLGVTLNYLSLIEQSKRRPGGSLLFHLAELLNVSEEWLQTGKLGERDHAKMARFSLWPELTFLAAIQFITPRVQSLADALPANDSIRAAISKALEARHWCEFWEWANSKEGRRTAEGFEGRGVIEELLDRTMQPLLIPQDVAWIHAAERIEMRVNKAKSHCSAVGTHSAKYACDCFEFEIIMCEDLLRRIPGLAGPWGSYGHTLLRRAFIERAFPVIFWSAARLWSDRRLASWLWYLGVPLDLFSTLARTARSYDSPDPFAAATRHLISQATIEHRDLFLGLFHDIGALQHAYAERFGVGHPFVQEVFFSRVAMHGFGELERRQENRRLLKSRLLLQLIDELGEDDVRRRTTEFLESTARAVRPYKWSEDGTLEAERVDKHLKEHPRLSEQPPDTLA